MNDEMKPAKPIKKPKAVRSMGKSGGAKATGAKVVDMAGSEVGAKAASSGKGNKAAKVEKTGKDGVRILRKNDLVEKVAAAADVKKKDAKAVVEAMLKIIGDALVAGEALVLPPFGKAKVSRHKALDSGHIYMVKLRRGLPGKGDDGDDATNAGTLAEDDE